MKYAISLAIVMFYSVATWAADYQARYGVDDVYTKITDNKGNGHEPLYGTRNLRVVLHGVLYRGGGNNAYHRDGKRNNANPLPDDGLENLCKEGFGTSIYLYSTNFSTAPKQTNCVIGKSTNSLDYQQITAARDDSDELILAQVYDRIMGKVDGPIYAHCWNGWHASGLIAALALQQFCGVSPQVALDYWTKNTDGNSKGYDSIKKRISEYKPNPQWIIDAKTQAKICPKI